MNKNIRVSIGAVLAIAGVNASWAAEGLWLENGRPVGTAADRQVNCQIAADGLGGAVIAWADLRNGTYDIYAQRVDAAGNTLWPAAGVAVCTASGNQLSPQLISDNYHGAIITWQDQRNINEGIYAQRVNGSGVPQWAANGVPVGMGASNQSNPQIVTDGNGGAMIAWQDERNGDSDIFALRLNNAGAVGAGWSPSGVTVCAAAADQTNPRLLYSGNGCAIIAWEDARSGTYTDIYAQRLMNTGVVDSLWTPDGEAICTASNDQTKPQLISDNAEGAIITWEDGRNGNGDVYAQRIPKHGSPQWAPNGVIVCNAVFNQSEPKIITDGSQGAILTWQDGRSGSSTDIYAQWIIDDGSAQWAVNGIGICNAALNQSNPQMIAYGSGGAIITWEDGRNGNADIYAQRISSVGSAAWPSNGAAVCNAVDDQTHAQLISDGNNGMIMAWQDGRNGVDYDIYAQRLVRLRPQVASVNSPAEQGSVFQAAITGNYFQSAPGSVAAAKLTRPALADIPAGHLSIVNNNYLTCDFNLADAAWGDWCVVVSDTYGQQSAELVLLNVLQPTATATVTSTTTPTPVVLATLTPSPTSSSTPTPLPGEMKYPDHAFVVPNPFLPALQQKAKIFFKLPDSTPDYKIKIINIKGRVARTLVQQNEWDGRNEQGTLCEGGVYFFQVEAGGARFNGKVVLIK